MIFFARAITDIFALVSNPKAYQRGCNRNLFDDMLFELFIKCESVSFLFIPNSTKLSFGVSLLDRNLHAKQ